MLDKLGHDDDVETPIIERRIEKIGLGGGELVSAAQLNRRFRQVDPTRVPTFVPGSLQKLANPAANIEKSSPACVAC